MVKSVTSFSRDGLRDWLLQRVTALLLGVYAVVIVAYLVNHYPVDYADWSLLFKPVWMKIFSVLAVFSVLIHAWIGLWTVYTDYLKCAVVRLVMQVATIFGLFAIVVWALMIMWG